ncbi:MAG: efflux RND transporter permease subunit, partial [Hyphomicrobium sp.]
ASEARQNDGERQDELPGTASPAPRKVIQRPVRTTGKLRPEDRPVATQIIEVPQVFGSTSNTKGQPATFWVRTLAGGCDFEIISLSFLPIFALEAQEGRLFHPLAFTKSFSMAAAALLSITVVPTLMTLFIKGNILPEQKNPINRKIISLYKPLIEKALKSKKMILGIAFVLLLASAWPASRLGSEFMPSLNEGTLLYMPTTLPGLSITKATELLQTQNKILKSFPEVESVWGKAGRAATATDPAPTEMFETIINLKPEEEWRNGLTLEKLIEEMNQELQFPGVSNAWTMPIKARIDMLATGIRTPVGIKVLGPDLTIINNLSRDIEVALRKVKGTSSAYAERIIGGYFIDIEPDRKQLARYGISIGDFQQVIASAVGAETVTTTVEGRERYGVSLRYPRDVRSDPDIIAREVLIPMPNGSSVPLGQVATIKRLQGPSTIRTENAQLAAYIFVDARDRDLVSYVKEAQKAVAAEVDLPTGYSIVWSGQFEYYERAKQRLYYVVPLTLLLITLLLYLNFKRLTETFIVLLSLPFALIGGLWLMWWLNYNLSVAVAVGFIGLAGVAAETGVIMLVFLEQAFETRRKDAIKNERKLTVQDLHAAIIEGAVERIRPKTMTVLAIMAGLFPILWSHGTGSEVMKRIAVPMVGGMITSGILTLIIIPVIYFIVKSRSELKGL